MMKTPRSDFTLEFKKEAVRLVRGGQRQSEVSASLGISGQTLGNWVKAEAAGRLTERAGVKAISDEQMEISRLKAELARTRMERDILKNELGSSVRLGR
jgi:transposase